MASSTEPKKYFENSIPFKKPISDSGLIWNRKISLVLGIAEQSIGLRLSSYVLSKALELIYDRRAFTYGIVCTPSTEKNSVLDFCYS